MPGYGTLYGDQYGTDPGAEGGSVDLDIFNQSPASGAESIGIDSNVSFSIRDLVQVVLSSMQIYVNAFLVFDGTSFQTGWGGSSYVANSYNGWDFTLHHTDYFEYGLTIPVRVVAQDPSGNAIDESWFFSTTPVYKKAILQIKAVAHDVLRVYFPEPVVTTQALTLVDNYLITPLTEGAEDVTVTGVRVLDPEQGLATYADVYISPVSIDALYRLEVRNQRNAAGSILYNGSLPGMAAHFLGRSTKADAMRGTFARLYSTRGVESTLLQIIVALALEDERLGGQGDLSPIPIPVPPPTTFGTSTYGTDDYGG
jgi:hypothetical protein